MSKRPGDLLYMPLVTKATQPYPVPGGLTLVVVAAGCGRKMRSYGPRPLLALGGGQTVLGRQIDLARECLGVGGVVVVAGEQADRYHERARREFALVENERHAETGVARSIALGLRAVTTQAALVVYGDLVFNRATLTGFPTHRSAVLVADGAPGDPGVGVTVNARGDAEHFDYGLPLKWGQVVLLAGEELRLFRRLAADPRRHPMLGFEVLNDVVDRGGRFFAHRAPGSEVVEIDRVSDLAVARRVAL
jgi:hypothetical protein